MKNNNLTPWEFWIKTSSKAECSISLSFIIQKFELDKKSNHHTTIFPRYFFCAFIRKNIPEKVSLAKLGSMLGGKDHSTIINALKNHNLLIETNDPKYLDLTSELSAYLNKNFYNIYNT